MCTININLIRSGPKINLSYSLCLHKSRSVINFRSSSLNLQRRRHSPNRISSVDDDFGDVSFGFGELDEMPENDPFYMMYSSGDESDTDMVLNPIGDVDLPLNNERNHVDTPEAALTLAAHRFASIQRGHKRKRKFLVPLPPPHGIANLGKFYLALTTFCFVAMGNGLNLTDGLDGFVGGVSALAFIGMSIAVLPISPDLAIFGASMAGACIGFLFHNRYKASIMMGDTGSFALGGALAAMAACTGMFIPLFISAGVFVIEVVSIIVQVLLSKASHRITRHALPLQYHLKLMGIKTPIIVAGAYALSSIFALVAGYVGLISA